MLAGCVIGVSLVLVLIATENPGDASLYPPRPGDRTVDVFVVDHVYHAGLIVPLADLSGAAGRDGNEGAQALGRRFAGHRYLEIGRGDERFYRHVPSIDRIEWRLAAAALFNVSHPSVLDSGKEPRDLDPRWNSMTRFRMLGLAFPAMAALPAAAQTRPHMSCSSWRTTRNPG